MTRRAPRSGRPRVVVVAEAFPVRGGIATFAETVAADPRLAAEFDVQLLNTARTTTREGGRLVPSNVLYALQDARAVLRASRTADLVHLQLVADPGLPVLRAVALVAAARAGGARVVAHSHSATGNAGRPDVADYSGRDRSLLRALRLTDLVLTVSEAGADALRPLLGGTPVRRMDNAVDVASFPLHEPDAAAEPTVLFVGVVCRRKGVPELARAAAELHRRGATRWRLVVAGGRSVTPEPEFREVEAELAAAGVADAAVGQLDPAQVRERLRTSDVFVLPSYLEGQPMAILEAMASGLPVVSTRVGATPQLVRDGVEGRLVEPGDAQGLADALQELVTDPARRRAMGAAARARALAHHDLPQLSGRLARAYREVLGLPEPDATHDRARGTEQEVSA